MKDVGTLQSIRVFVVDGLLYVLYVNLEIKYVCRYVACSAECDVRGLCVSQSCDLFSFKGPRLKVSGGK